MPDRVSLVVYLKRSQNVRFTVLRNKCRCRIKLALLHQVNPNFSLAEWKSKTENPTSTGRACWIAASRQLPV